MKKKKIKIKRLSTKQKSEHEIPTLEFRQWHAKQKIINKNIKR